MRIMKFGGSSLATKERMEEVVKIVCQNKKPQEQLVVVCSALGGVTNELIELGRLASQGEASYRDRLSTLAERHRALWTDQTTEKFLDELTRILEGVFGLKECSERSLDLIMSFGERLSTYMVAELLRMHEPATRFLDTREVIKTDDHFGSAQVDLPATEAAIAAHGVWHSPIVVATGYIASTASGVTTTLGRGGSDYTASLLGAALQVEAIEIWTDVSGVLTADPRKVSGAFPIEEMSYEEAMEMAHFGAKVIYFPTMRPAMSKKIPIWIKNTFAPTDHGTLIHHQANGHAFPVKGISSIDAIALLRVQGPGMPGVAGIAMRLFTALAHAQVNVVMITQGSSEYSICVAVAPEVAAQASQALKEEFAPELFDHRLEEIVMETNLSVVAVVGERMRQTPGIGGRLFGALAAAAVNVVAVAQGSSERNISLIIASADLQRALPAIHDHFFSSTRVIHLCLIGLGGVGQALLSQIQSLKRGPHEPAITLMAVANSRQMLVSPLGLHPTTARQALTTQGEPTNLPRLRQMLVDLGLPKTVVVDCTASDEPVREYAALLRAGIAVVTSNKRAMSGDQERQQLISLCAKTTGSTFAYHTNVGAGLPIIQTIQQMRATGDQMERLEGVLSGTMSFLFNGWDGTVPFSARVAEAKANGYTEPDPGEDLSGTDVARKLVVLGREMGLTLELSDVVVESLAHVSDQEMGQRLAEASAEGKVLRYLASLTNGRAEVALQAVGPEHPAFSLTGRDNLVTITSRRYQEQPLVIRGPGAGTEVTAAGVLADVLQA